MNKGAHVHNINNHVQCFQSSWDLRIWTKWTIFWDKSIFQFPCASRTIEIKCKNDYNRININETKLIKKYFFGIKICLYGNNFLELWNNLSFNFLWFQKVSIMQMYLSAFKLKNFQFDISFFVRVGWSKKNSVMHRNRTKVICA